MDFFYNTSADRRAYGKTLLLAVRLTALLIITACLQVSAKTTTAQRVSISLHNGSLERLFTEIEKKTNYVFFYDVAILKNTKAVTVEVKDASVEDILQTSLKGQALDYSIHDRTIFVKKKDDKTGEKINAVMNPEVPGEISGTVLAEDGTPLSGATIKLKDGRAIGMTDERGVFKVKNIGGNTVIEISFTGYTPQEVQLANKSNFTVSLIRATNKLDEVQVIAYGTTTQRLNTGNVTTIKSKEIEEQPVTNVLAALEGRVPGLIITQNTGAPGGSFKVQIRGQNSISNGNDPFYVIDGVPYPSQLINNLNGIGNSGSPLNFINPSDIESVDVLKDADATAIYGSRAANGAILITTKKGKAGTTRTDINVYSGIGEVGHTIKYLNTRQYLLMRYEALKNDGDSLTDPNLYAPDLLQWDTTRYTDWQKLFLSGRAKYTNVQGTVTGGNTNTQYLIGGNYHRETTVYSGNSSDQKGSLHFNINSTSPNHRFLIQLSGSYLADISNLPSTDLMAQIQYLPPNAPPIYNPDGSLNWANGTWTNGNPMAASITSYAGHTYNLVSNAMLVYKLLPGLEIRTGLGYNTLQQEETILFPAAAQDPSQNPTANSQFNTSNSRSWNIEPQISYEQNLRKGKLNALIGTSFQNNTIEGQQLYASGFSSDALLANLHAAASISLQSIAAAQYKYNAFFGRLNYNWEDKYLLNLTVRRDGSSRFGPGKQFGNFGAVGAGWIFSREKFIQDNFSFLSFGKIRGSYGITGNDQIGDYGYLNLYSNSPYPYQNTQGLLPSRLFNPDLAWEINKKLEGAIELGLLRDRILISASYFRNRSSNELVSNQLSLVTGFSSVAENLPALVQNTGFEFVINTINIKAGKFSWTSSFNLTANRNKLLAYPNLKNSNLIVGRSLSIARLFHFAGVDPQTGVYEFKDQKGNITTNPANPADLTSIIDLTPRYYGGFQNSFKYKGFGLDILFQFTRQRRQDFLSNVVPGSEGFNQPATVLQRWQKPGDVTNIERFNQDFSLYNSYNNATLYSDRAYSDASFIRLKNLAFSYEISKWKRKNFLQSCRFYVQAQNLLTITKYIGYDPETLSSTSLPPLRVITTGVQFTL
jgi:TonB-linked SusC/RagA family outer membrane protein